MTKRPSTHRMLARQLRRVGASEEQLPKSPEQWRELLGRVSRAYADAEDDRYTLERAMEISSRELSEATEQARSASRAKSAFLANMSHEIRTPMNGVIGIADLLASSLLDDAQRELVHTLRRSGESLLLLLNDILDLSKIEAGRLELDDQDFDPTELTGDVTDLLAEAASCKGVELSCLVDPDVSRILRGDPNRLRQILLNLVGNAIKFTAAGHVILRTRLLYRTAQSEVLWFEVEDSGIGIESDVQSELFDAFTQADASTTRRYGGTGLGLSISRKLVEMMNGEIGLQSVPGRGSRFFFHIELQQAKDPAPSPDPSLELPGMKVLFVDDSEINRRVMRWQANVMGLDLTLADGAEEALAILADRRASDASFELIVLDYLMPDMDGVDLAEAIAERGLALDAPIVLLSSSYDLAATQRAQQLECFDILRKPMKTRELTRVFARARRCSRIDESRSSTRTRARETTSALNLKVLLAEDNDINQRVASLMLAGMGCEVIIAGDGREAVARFREQDFDVILMDCQMPRMGGIDATAAIREIEDQAAKRATPIVALTANAMNSDREACLAAGMDEFLTKPVRSTELHAALAKATAPSDAGPADS